MRLYPGASSIRAGNRIATDVPLVGEAKEALEALQPLLARREDRSFLEGAQKGMADMSEAFIAGGAEVYIPAVENTINAEAAE